MGCQVDGEYWDCEIGKMFCVLMILVAVWQRWQARPWSKPPVACSKVTVGSRARRARYEYRELRSERVTFDQFCRQRCKSVVMNTKLQKCKWPCWCLLLRTLKGSQIFWILCLPSNLAWHCPESFESEDIGKYGTILRFWPSSLKDRTFCLTASSSARRKDHVKNIVQNGPSVPIL